jgi:hypothetical protein
MIGNTQTESALYLARFLAMMRVFTTPLAQGMACWLIV